MATLQIVGGGKMGEALIGGILRAGLIAPAQVRIVEASPARRSELETRFPGVVVAPGIAEASGSIIAVKPADVAAVVAAVAKAGSERILSIAAGVTIAQLERAAGDGVAVVRAMPNTPALVGEGASAIAAGTSADDDDLAWAEALLGGVGLVVRVGEYQLDAVTGLSGSGPAYVFLIAEALIDAGVSVGLPRDLAVALAQQTLLGASTLLAQSDDSAADLRAAVTSPGGTTAAGVRVLEQQGVRAALVDAVHAAAARSQEMSK
ncbi:MAG: pyrroline-5-carboxylate reductase [Actinobacteria bacterium]|nr:pyrroline-5-carboxylate reductase [Actinomycetota bacterium]